MAVSICPQSHFNRIWHKVVFRVGILCIHLISHKNGSALQCCFLCGDLSGITDWSWYSPISAMERRAINSSALWSWTCCALKHTYRYFCYFFIFYYELFQFCYQMHLKVTKFGNPAKIIILKSVSTKGVGIRSNNNKVE